MKTNGLLFLTLVMLLIILACGSQPPIPPSLRATQTPLRLPSPSSSSSPTLTESPTSLPTLTPTSTTQPTLIPTVPATFTNTSLPPLPDFQEALTYVTGGGGLCQGDPRLQPPILVGFVNPGNATLICFREQIGPLQLDWHAPDGRIFTSMIDTSRLIEFFFRWPLSLPPGEWRLDAYGNGYSESVNFVVPAENISVPYIAAIDPRSVNEINLGGSLPLKEDGKLDVIGLNYPAKHPIYLLVYQQSPTGSEYRLVHKQSVLSDSSGSIAAELSGFSKVGDFYLVIGISNPNVSLVRGGNNSFNDELPFDAFKVVSSKSASSCPGAPPQRMIINQRGSVCTEGDNVRLRDAPQKSANEITSLPMGSQFTVIGGPACSDNWSWWQVRTDNGNTGWISEGGDQTDPYFICPLP